MTDIGLAPESLRQSHFRSATDLSIYSEADFLEVSGSLSKVNWSNYRGIPRPELEEPIARTKQDARPCLKKLVSQFDDRFKFLERFFESNAVALSTEKAHISDAVRFCLENVETTMNRHLIAARWLSVLFDLSLYTVQSFVNDLESRAHIKWEIYDHRLRRFGAGEPRFEYGLRFRRKRLHGDISTPYYSFLYGARAVSRYPIGARGDVLDIEVARIMCLENSFAINGLIP